ncbi:PEP-CTERM/exosortase system-associated acyltransferase [Motiliproteus sp. SC1-56]|uniref:PEP-CTERM/exosortase system-associated acyltransferase n=1 Tax=Motiliproteus sp. SC1-56 TaxID=2799565 RepID=UPI001A8E23E4|nr:PEP-CTERM/exosortase system-associated acyltransferase [Motiliproteus sp. SC1-56]
MNRDELAVKFMRYFRIVVADTDALRRECYKIRYNVYCDELSFENKADFPEELESDPFDLFSDHILLLHRQSREYAGTVRLVRPLPDQPQQKLPMEHFCLHALSAESRKILQDYRATTAEASRLAVPRMFRRRTGEERRPFVIDGVRTYLSDEDVAHFPYIAVGLYLACATVLIKELNYIMVMMEPRLARHLARVGILFESAGELVDYHGKRAPFYITPEVFEQNLKPHVRVLFEAVQAQVLEQLPK